MQSHAPASAEHDSGKGPRLGNQPSNARRLGAQSRRVADPDGRGDEARPITGSYIQADETPVDVQTREGRGHNHQAYLWQYSRPGGTVVFDFRLGRGRDGPKRFLGQFEGILQTDGYAAYDQISGPEWYMPLAGLMQDDSFSKQCS